MDDDEKIFLEYLLGASVGSVEEQPSPASVADPSSPADLPPQVTHHHLHPTPASTPVQQEAVKQEIQEVVASPRIPSPVGLGSPCRSPGESVAGGEATMFPHQAAAGTTPASATSSVAQAGEAQKVQVYRGSFTTGPQTSALGGPQVTTPSPTTINTWLFPNTPHEKTVFTPFLGFLPQPVSSSQQVLPDSPVTLAQSFSGYDDRLPAINISTADLLPPFDTQPAGTLKQGHTYPPCSSTAVVTTSSVVAGQLQQPPQLPLPRRATAATSPTAASTAAAAAAAGATSTASTTSTATSTTTSTTSTAAAAAAAAAAAIGGRGPSGDVPGGLRAGHGGQQVPVPITVHAGVQRRGRGGACARALGRGGAQTGARVPRVRQPGRVQPVHQQGPRDPDAGVPVHAGAPQVDPCQAAEVPQPPQQDARARAPPTPAQSRTVTVGSPAPTS
ncbi:mucin-5AC-like isoform X2 [Scylla paramamosain]|uniref:mucin-5AC-like isoform X2 n=1 Tax=Scylla paramamosain TaxID=85552 RepID=UPI003083383F